MRERLLFGLYLSALAALLWVRAWPWLVPLALLAPLLDFQTAKRALWAVALFGLGVSLGYALQAWWLDHPWRETVDFLLLINLRVYAMTFLTLFVVRRINIARALDFSPTLRFLYLASMSQIYAFTRTLEDFRLALKARTLGRLKEKTRRDMVGALLHFFVKKSLFSAKERTLALKARGFFD